MGGSVQSKGLSSVTVDNKQAHPKHSGESHSIPSSERNTAPGASSQELISFWLSSRCFLPANNGSFCQLWAKTGIYPRRGSELNPNNNGHSTHYKKCLLSFCCFFSFFSLMPSTPVNRDLKLTPFALVCAYRLTPSLKYIGRIYTITANRQALQKHQEVKCIFL